VSSDHQYTGILEKVTEGWAVILIDPDERELAFDAKQLPANISPGDAVVIEMDGDQVIGLTRDTDRTAKRHQRIKSKMDRLRQRRKRISE
jgi:hypothetical protein